MHFHLSDEMQAREREVEQYHHSADHATTRYPADYGHPYEIHDQDHWDLRDPRMHKVDYQHPRTERGPVDLLHDHQILGGLPVHD